MSVMLLIQKYYFHLVIYYVQFFIYFSMKFFLFKFILIEFFKLFGLIFLIKNHLNF